MGEKRCCCERDCTIVEEAWPYADGTYIGPKFIKNTGASTAWIASNRLVMSAGGEVVTVASHPVQHWTARASVELPNVVANRKYRVFCESLGVVGNYLAAEYDTSGSGTLRLVDSTGTLDEVTGVGVTSPSGILICRSSEGGFASVDHASTYAWDCVGTEGLADWKAGIANASAAGDCEFGRFHWEEHKVTNPDCYTCACECRGHCLPETLYVTIKATGCCEERNDVTFEINFLDACLPDFIWYGTATIPKMDYCLTGGTTTIYFALHCQPDSSQPWEACFQVADDVDCAYSGQDDCSYSCVAAPNVDERILSISENCDSLELVFPEITCTFSGGTCSYYFIVTE